MISGRTRNVLIASHVAVAVSVLGADLVLLTLGLWGLNGADTRAVYPAASLIGTWLVAPLAVAALGTGLALALLTPWGLFRHRWVTIKLAITTVLSAAVLFVLVPRLGAAADAATAVTAVPAPPRLPLAIAPAAASALLVLAVFLAVLKPGSAREASFSAG